MKRLLFGLLLMVSAGANASIVYHWSGTCASGCVGPATAVLKLANTYTPGAVLSDADFLSFAYGSSSGAVSVPGDGSLFGFFSSSLPVVKGASTNFILDFAGGSTIFTAPDAPGGPDCGACPDGVWVMIFSPLGILDIGTDAGVWVRTPGPSTLVLLGLGLLGVGYARRRRRQ